MKALINITVLCISLIFLGAGIEKLKNKYNQPEYKINLFNQTKITIESTQTKTVDTIQFNSLEEWIEKDNL